MPASCMTRQWLHRKAGLKFEHKSVYALVLLRSSC